MPCQQRQEYGWNWCWLAQTVYPDLFSDIDLTEEVKAYYLDVFGVDLTDEQADSIFTPPSSAAAGF